MNTDMKLVFTKVTMNDVDAMTVIMKKAFDEDTRRHLGKEAGGPPGYDNGDFIRKWYVQSGADAYKIILNGEMIGGFNIFRCSPNEYFLGNIFISPECQDKGVGTSVWKQIEKMYPDARKWSTETPGFSKRNHIFFINKCGFNLVKIENPGDLMEESYILEKRIK